MTALLACILAFASAAVVFTVAVMLSTASAAALEADACGDVAASSCAVTRDEEDGNVEVELADEPFADPFALERLFLLGLGRKTRPLSLVVLMSVL